MKTNSNIEEIQKSFGEQAAGFESNQYHLSKAEYQEYMVQKAQPGKADRILEVAAGTCICGRAFAPHVAHVTCLDATPEMLQIGKEEAEKKNLFNMTFVKGNAEKLPFLDNSFDLVMSRLAFHHFVNPKEIFSEMKRVLKSGGKLLLMDMTVGDEAVRDEVDRIERMRDFSHVRDLTLGEMQKLYAENNMQLEIQEQIHIPVSLQGWMDFTNTSEDKQQEIRQLMERDMAGEINTGFSPYRKENQIYFNHHWVLNLGKKGE